MTCPGWFRVPRAILETAWYRNADPFTRNLWLLLLCWARFRPGKTDRGLEIRPGQVLTSWKKVAEEMTWTKKGRRVTPPTTKCRRAAEFLRNAGEATWVPTGHPTYTGIVITLERWGLYAGQIDPAADVAADLVTDGLPEERQDQKKETGSAGSADRQTPKSAMRNRISEWERLEREGRKDVEEEHRRQRGAVIHR